MVLALPAVSAEVEVVVVLALPAVSAEVELDTCLHELIAYERRHLDGVTRVSSSSYPDTQHNTPHHNTG